MNMLDRENRGGPGKLWSLWDLLKLEIGKLLELHERIVIERGYFERAIRELHRQADEPKLRMEYGKFRALADSVSEIARIAESARLESTRIAAQRFYEAMQKLGEPEAPPTGVFFPEEGCRMMFNHLMEIASRIRDDCSGRKYFQIAPENASLLEPDVDHFGDEVRKAFNNAEDISEAASCLAVERPTACVFHLMRALEKAASVVANKIDATVIDQNGKGLPWGVIADNMKTKIDKMPKGSDEQIKWYRVQSFLEVLNRAWRAPTAHPKQTYTMDEARNVFDAAKAFMRELASLA